MRIAPVVVVAAMICAAPRGARAGRDAAWTAARANLPDDTPVLIGMDFARLRTSFVYPQVSPLAWLLVPELERVVDDAHATCKIDLAAAVQRAVIGADAHLRHGAIFLTGDRLGEKRIVGCLRRVAKATTEGKITELLIEGKGAIYLTWLDGDVLVASAGFTTRDEFETWIGASGLAGSAVAKVADKVDTRAALWAATVVSGTTGHQETILGGYGAITFAKAAVTADVHVVFATPAEASGAAARATKDIATDAAHGCNVRQDVLSRFPVVAVGPEVRIQGTAPERDVYWTAVGLTQTCAEPYAPP